MAVQRVLRDTRATLEVTFYSAGVATNADGAVTVDVTRADGTALDTGAATTNAGTGIYRYVLAPQADLEYFKLVWSGTFGGVAQKITTHAEIVGAFYVALADLRAADGLADATKFPVAKLEEGRQWFEDLAEAFCGLAFVPRFTREVLDGNATVELELVRTFPRKVLSAKVGGTAQTGLATWDLYDFGLVVRDTGSFASGKKNVEITYEHGLDEPDAQLRQAALTAIRARLLGDRSGIPERAVSMSTEVGGFTLMLAGANRPTAIPEVDAVLMARRIPMVA